MWKLSNAQRCGNWLIRPSNEWRLAAPPRVPPERYRTAPLIKLQNVPFVVYADHSFLRLEAMRLVSFVLFRMMTQYRIGLIPKRTAAMTFRPPAATSTEYRVQWNPAQHRG